MIYLRCSAEVCFERCRKRCREEEKSLPVEYLQQIHDRHEEWLVEDRRKENLPILIIDTDEGNSIIPDFEHNPLRAMQIVEQVRKFIEANK